MIKVEIYTTPTCPYCIAAKRLLKQKKVDYTEISVWGDSKRRAEMTERSKGGRTVPQIFIDNEPIGGCDDLYQLDAEGKLDNMLGVLVEEN